MAYFDVDDPVREKLQELYESSGKGTTISIDSVTGETILGAKKNPTAADWRKSYQEYIANDGPLMSAPKGMSNTRFYQHSLFEGSGMNYYSQPPVSRGLLADIQGTLAGTQQVTEEETKELEETSADPNRMYRRPDPPQEQFGDESSAPTDNTFNLNNEAEWAQWSEIAEHGYTSKNLQDMITAQKDRNTKLEESKLWQGVKSVSWIAKLIDEYNKNKLKNMQTIREQRAMLTGDDMRNPSWRGYMPEDFSAFNRTTDPLSTQFSALRGDLSWSPPTASKSTAKVVDYSQMVRPDEDHQKREMSNMSKYGDFATKSSKDETGDTGDFGQGGVGDYSKSGDDAGYGTQNDGSYGFSEEDSSFAF